MSADNDFLQKILTMFDGDGSNIKSVAMNEYFEHADLALAMNLPVAKDIKSKTIAALCRCDDVNGEFYLALTTLVAMNGRQFDDQEVATIASIYEPHVAEISNPMTVHFMGDFLERRNVEIDWSMSPFAKSKKV